MSTDAILIAVTMITCELIAMKFWRAKHKESMERLARGWRRIVERENEIKKEWQLIDVAHLQLQQKKAELPQGPPK